MKLKRTVRHFCCFHLILFFKNCTKSKFIFDDLLKSPLKQIKINNIRPKLYFYSKKKYPILNFLNKHLK